MNKPQSDFVKWLDGLIGEGKKYRSNVAFSEHVGISEGTVRRMLAGESPSLNTLRKIAAAEPEVSLVDLQQMFGILPRHEDQVKEHVIRAMENILARLPEEDQQFILDMAKRMLEKNQQESEE